MLELEKKVGVNLMMKKNRAIKLINEPYITAKGFAAHSTSISPEMYYPKLTTCSKLLILTMTVNIRHQ